MRVLALVLLAGCGDNLVGAVDGARSGERLRLYWFETSDGVRHWQAREGVELRETAYASTEVYYDRVLELPCSATPWLDGVTRCTPDVELIAEKFYLDSACTMRVTRFPDKYQLVADYDPKCGERRLWHVYPVTQTIAPAPVYQVLADGKCWPSTLPNPRALGVLGDELAPGAFIALDTTTSDDRDQRIQVRYRESGDGMRLPIGLHDALLGPAQLADDVAQPLVGGTVTTYFADASCTTSLLRVEPGCAAPASAKLDAYHRVGARVDAPFFYAESNGVCVAVIPSEGDYYALEPEPYSLAAMVTTPDVAAGQRLALRYANTGARRVRAQALFDTQLGMACELHEFPDAVHRCVPDRTLGDIVEATFSDPACQTPIAVALVNTDAPPRYLMRDNALVDGTVRIVELGERLAQPIYAQRFACEQYPSDRLHRIVRDVEWSELASATLVTE